MADAVLDSALLLDQLRDPRQRPQSTREPHRLGPAPQAALDAFQLELAQLGAPSTEAARAELALAAVGQRLGPAAHRLPMHSDLARHVRLAPALAQQLSRSQPPRLESFEITPHTSWIAHDPQCSGKNKKCHYLLRSSIVHASHSVGPDSVASTL